MDERCKRLRFRAWRRGFRELDLIMGPFADAHVTGLDAVELAALEGLLDAPDQDVYSWIIGRAPTPADFEGSLMQKLGLFARTMAQPAPENAAP